MLAQPLANIQPGHGVASFPSVDDVGAARGESFDLTRLPDLLPGQRVLFPNLNTRWCEVIHTDPQLRKNLHEVSHGWWRVDPLNARACPYVVAHALGVVRGVFKVTGWSERRADGLSRFYADTTPPEGMPGAHLRNKNIAGVFTPGRAAVPYVPA